ncbi:GNAT family N-acetyltransferase [Pandoraea sp. PE-S2T-3]|uniref:GNAT family N-acetyltransferase n=1 Tax=Pandoraea sp. PE-S2T-3 TaxID=1986993 RepID=UPI0034E8B747
MPIDSIDRRCGVGFLPEILTKSSIEKMVLSGLCSSMEVDGEIAAFLGIQQIPYPLPAERHFLSAVPVGSHLFWLGPFAVHPDHRGAGSSILRWTVTRLSHVYGAEIVLVGRVQHERVYAMYRRLLGVQIANERRQGNGFDRICWSRPNPS